MPETEWPKRFYLARFVIVASRLLALACMLTIPLAFRFWPSLGAPLPYMVSALALLVARWILLTERKPVIELHPDHVALANNLTGRLVGVPYENIARLEEVPQLLFTITYKTTGGHRRAFLQPERIGRFEELKTILRERTRLEVTVQHPAWARPMRVVLEAFPSEDWQSYVFAPLFMMLSIAAGSATLMGFVALYLYGGVLAPSWLLVTLPPFVSLTVITALTWLRARIRRRQASKATG